MRRREEGTHFLWLIALCFLVAGCPRAKRSVGPKLPVPKDGNAQALARFQSNQTQFEQDAKVDNSEAFEAIVREFPNDPIVPHALLYGGMADLRAGDESGAIAKFDELAKQTQADPMLLARGRLFRGIGLASQGRAASAVEDLRAGAKALNRADREELAWWSAAMAEGLAESDPGAAIGYYDAWWRFAREAEREYIIDRVTGLAASLDEATMKSLYVGLKHRDGPAAAIVGGRYVSLLNLRGDQGEAAKYEAAVQAALRTIGLGSAEGTAGAGGDPSMIGALLPMTGRLNRVGELSMRGLVLSSGKFSRDEKSPLMPSGFELSSRDTNSTALTVVRNLEELVRNEAIAVVGPFDGRGVAQVAPAAARLGVPVISLAPRGAASAAVLSIRHSAEARAQALARHAYDKGIRDFAIFSPSTSYGNVVGKAFRDEVERLGGAIVVEARYAKGTTSFKSDVKKLRKPWSAVFVPDLAKSLQLIAPALAAANFNARPQGKKSKHGRSMMLLSTAEGLDERYLRAAGRYSWGAVLAPGFFPDRTDPRIAEFVGQFESEFASTPTAHEAYAFDAATIIRHAVEQGARTRSQLATALRRQQVPALTGKIRFGADGRRADPGLLFEVQQPLSDQFELRALR